MKNYFNRNYQDIIISQYSINEINRYLYHISSIQNIALTSLKTSCVLSGLETYVIDKTNNNLIFYVYPGKGLTNIIFLSIETPIIIDTQESITYSTIGILLNTDGKKVRCFLVDIDRIWNPDSEVFDPNHLIFAYFRLVPYQDKFRAYGSILTDNYLKTLDNLGIDYNTRVGEIGFSSECDNSKINYNSSVGETDFFSENVDLESHISEIDLNIRPLLMLNEAKIIRNFQQYLVDTYPPLTASKIIPDIPTYSMRQERITRHLSIFDGFYNDFYC